MAKRRNGRCSEGGKENVKGGNKGFRGEIKGTRTKEENKRCR